MFCGHFACCILPEISLKWDLNWWMCSVIQGEHKIFSQCKQILVSSLLLPPSFWQLSHIMADCKTPKSPYKRYKCYWFWPKKTLKLTWGIAISFWQVGQESMFFGLRNGNRHGKQNKCLQGKTRRFLPRFMHKLHVVKVLLSSLVSPSTLFGVVNWMWTCKQ